MDCVVRLLMRAGVLKALHQSASQLYSKPGMCAACAMMLTGCIAATSYETLRGIPSLRHSMRTNKSAYTRIHRQKNRHAGGYPYLLKIGGTHIYFGTIRLSEDVVSAGPLLPIIPVPEKPKDYGAARIKIRILAWPEKEVISFYPNQFRIYARQTKDGVSPVYVLREKSYGAYVSRQGAAPPETITDVSKRLTISKARSDAASVWPLYALVFDIRIKEVKEFVLIPGPMHVKENVYLLPDIEYRRYRHTAYD